MSRDVITVGSTMRILLLYRGEYSQWRERFMNYLKEQTDGEAMINCIHNGDQPLRVIAQVSLAGNAHNAHPTLKDLKFWTAKEKKTRKINRTDIANITRKEPKTGQKRTRERIEPNGDALRKCILEGPYQPTTVTIPIVPATENSLAVPKRTTVETILTMSPENKAHFELEKEAIHLLLTGIRDEIYSIVDACKTAHELWQAIERL
nr:hypothetical protein [Tanacetum cinerariifolium]